MPRLPALLVVSLVIILSSCVRYQYATINSDTKGESKNEFASENDSVEITYRFQGDGGAVHVRIFNKLDVPLYIDWSRSSLVLNGQARPFVLPQIRINGEYDAYATSARRGTFVGRAVEEELHSFIPARSFRIWNHPRIHTSFFQTPKKKRSAYYTTKATTMGTTPAHEFLFDRTNSPLHIKSLITVSTSSDLEEAFVIEEDFWVSSVIETLANPRTFQDERSYNQFYNGKATGFGVTVASVVILIVVVSLSLEQ